MWTEQYELLLRVTDLVKKLCEEPLNNNVQSLRTLIGMMRARWGTGRLDAFRAWLWLSCTGGSGAVQEGEERVVVGGLDGWYGVQADAFVGAVQALVVHAESCGGGDA
jgi:hypothetical protein